MILAEGKMTRVAFYSLAAALILVTGCSSQPEGKISIPRQRVYPDNAFKELDYDYLSNDWAPRGRVESFSYETRNNLRENSESFQKSALVYLPASYDENDTERRYNVMYLMHGGNDSPQWYFGGEGQSTRLTRLLDSMIERKEIEPLIICAVSYYTNYSNDFAANCRNFHFELMNDIIPVFESKYHSHARDLSPEGIAASRNHRAFGGFSMGAVTTWSVFENRLESFKYFMPISGDSWALGNTAGGSQPTMTALHLASKVGERGKTAEDFIIYSGSGENDIATPNLQPQINAMSRLSDTFIYCDNFQHGNLYLAINPYGGHDINTVINIMHNGLPKMFD